MRPDLSHVYNTPARRNRDAEACVKDSRVRVRDPDDLPRFEGIADARRRGWERKTRTHHWGALKRWLRAQVGRPWNDVWSEICSVSDLRSGATRTLRDAVDWNVELHTHTDADGVVRTNGSGYEVDGLYVDPADGVLRHRERERSWRRRDRDGDTERVRVSAEREFHRIDGLWYEVLYAELPPSEPRKRVREDGSVEVGWTSPSAFDVLDKTTVYRRAGLRWNKERTRYAYAKRALSKKELKTNGLVNDPALHDARSAPGARRRRFA